MTALAKQAMRYGRWTVIGGPMTDEKGHTKWLCRCDCGTERYVAQRSLIYGASQSCGCLARENASSATAYDLTGKTFGQLTALRRVPAKTKNGGAVWLCRCFCGNTCEVLATLLVNGRKTHCGCQRETHYHFADITGQRFNRLTALYPTDKRTDKGSLVWHCRCDCGNEVDVSYNELMFTSRQSCGCQKKEHDEKLPQLITRVAGTSVDHLRSAKIPSSNTTGAKGVYRIRGKYVAKIVFQKKQYYLGKFDTLEAAIQARKEGEELFFGQTLRYWEKWKERAAIDPQWAEHNPVQIEVHASLDGKLKIVFQPEMHLTVE